MSRSSIINVVGFVILGSVFLLSLVRTVGYSSREFLHGDNVIRIAHNVQEDGMRRGIEAVAEAYMRLHPEVTVHQQVIPQRVYPSWARTKLVSDQATDLMMIQTGEFEDLLLTDFHLLNPFMDAPNPYNTGTQLEKTVWLETFVDSLVSPPASRPLLASFYGAPITASTTRLLFNRPLMREILGKVQVPADFGSFTEICRKVQAYAGRTNQSIYPMVSYASATNPFWSSLATALTQDLKLKISPNRSAGSASWIVSMAYLEGKWNLRSPEIVLGLELTRELGRFAQPGFLQQKPQDALFYFVQGHSLFFVTNSLEAQAVRSQAPFSVGAFELPLPDTSDPAYGSFILGRRSEGGGLTQLAFGLTRHAKNHALALDFLHFLASVPGNQLFADVSGRLPAIVGVEPRDDIKPFAPKLEGYPNGFSITTCGPDVRALYGTHEYLLFSEGGSVKAFIDAIEPDIDDSIVNYVSWQAKRIRDNLEYHDSWLGALWALGRHQTKADGGVEDQQEAFLRPLLESQTVTEIERYWMTHQIKATGHEMHYY